MFPVSLAAHPAFDKVREERIDSLNVVFAEYRHRVTGARHIHLSADNSENVFLVAFPTMPMDSTGVAHILEHTALCGSERYPVRDPFFMMIRRSLNTFMNAFTSSDWTAYPFATQNSKDFHNLLGVYLDAVFFARLDPLDFAQEGIRLEFAEPGNPESDLVYKGVVFNEMKGALSSPVSLLWEAVNKYLFPSTTYHYNSGGDPAHIPDLRYEDLVAFYRKHYHPSNAVIMTFGDKAPADLQAEFESLALSRFERLDQGVHGVDEKRYLAPVRVEEAYALDEEDDAAHTHVVMSWLLGKATNLQDRFEALLLNGVLLDNSSSPLRHALETASFATSPSPLCGADESSREITFMAGVEGTEVIHAGDTEQLILDVLKRVAEEGVPQEQVEAVLHQIELGQREIGGDRYPYGLSIILQALSPVLQDADPLPVLEMDPVLADLREKIRNPDYVPSLIRKWLLDNPHRVRLTLRPDRELSARAEADEKARLARIREQLSADDKARILASTQALLERQASKDDPELLPRVGREDVPAEFHVASGSSQRLTTASGEIPVATYAQGTNGLVYQQLILDLPALAAEQEMLLPFYVYALAELGTAGHGYLEQQHRQAAFTGGMGMSLSTRTSIADAQQGLGHLVFSGKALVRNNRDFSALLREQFEQARFDEHERLSDLFSQMKSRWENSITGNGHALAMQAASGRMSAIAAWNHRLYGLNGIRHIRQTYESIQQGSLTTAALAAGLQSIHEQVLKAPRQMLLVSESERIGSVVAEISQVWTDARLPVTQSMFVPAAVSESSQVAWVANTQVQFCSRAYPAVPVAHPDSAALMVLGGFLRNGYLHRAIREQGGAYGGGAAYDGNSCAFRFYSYRDPRFEETLTDFDRSIDWLLTNSHEERQLEESMLGIIADMDKPLSPSGEAKQAFHNALYGRTPEQRRQMRERILAVGLPDLDRVVRTYLVPGKASTAAIIPAGAQSRAEAMGLGIEKL